MNKFKKGLDSILLRLKNPGTVMAITGAVLLILGELGFTVDNEKVNGITGAVCYILITMGVMNDSTTRGVYIPFIKDKYLTEEIKEEEL